MEGTTRRVPTRARWFVVWLVLCVGFYALHLALWLHNRFVVDLESLG